MQQDMHVQDSTYVNGKVVFACGSTVYLVDYLRDLLFWVRIGRHPFGYVDTPLGYRDTPL